MLVDDGSRAPLLGALRRSSLKRWTYVYRPDNRGPAFSRNEGLRLAAGRLIAFLDSDDIWYPRKLEVQLKQFLDPRVAFAHSNVDQIDGAGKRTLRRVIRPRDRDPRTGFPRSLPYTSTIMARRELFERIGGFDARFRYYYDDSDFWCRVRKAFPGGIRFLDRALAAYRFPAGRDGAAERFSLGGPSHRLPPRVREYLLDQALFTMKRKRAADPLAMAKYRHGRHAE